MDRRALITEITLLRAMAQEIANLKAYAGTGPAVDRDCGLRLTEESVDLVIADWGDGAYSWVPVTWEELDDFDETRARLRKDLDDRKEAHEKVLKVLKVLKRSRRRLWLKEEFGS